MVKVIMTRGNDFKVRKTVYKEGLCILSMETANYTALKGMQPKLTKVAKEVAKTTSGYLDTVISVLK